MDWQKLKERVVDEVIRQLSTSGGAADADTVKAAVTAVVSGNKSSAPVPAPVVAAPAPVPNCAVPDHFTTDVLVVLAGPGSARNAVQSLVDAGLKVSVVAAREATTDGLVDMAACYADGGLGAVDKLVAGAKLIAVPTLSLQSATAVANLSATCMACTAIVRAAATGKKVIALRDGLNPPNGATWSMRQKLESIIGQLKGFGISFADPNRFAADVSKAMGGQAPAYRFSGTTTVGSAGRPAPSESMRPLGSGSFVPAYNRAMAPHPSVARNQEVAKHTMSNDFDRDLAQMIDHTLLKPEATEAQVTRLCQEAVEYGFWSVCVNPTWVPLAARLLKGSPVKVCTVIGFPLGATSSTAKALETADVIQKGATEVDMVINVGALKSKQFDLVLEDMKAVVGAAKGRALTKVILETGLLTDDEKVNACQLAKEAGLDYVKTATGFGPGGATPADIALMRKTVGDQMGVKASGGIRDYDTAMAVVKAGASRIGASASVNIVKRVKAEAGKKGY